LHHPDAKVSKYRKEVPLPKPAIGLLEKAANDLRVSLNECYMIGDGIPDIVAGSRAVAAQFSSVAGSVKYASLRKTPTAGLLLSRRTFGVPAD